MKEREMKQRRGNKISKRDKTKELYSEGISIGFGWLHGIGKHVGREKEIMLNLVKAIRKSPQSN